MEPVPVESLFLRFRERADTKALAAVFDRTAPEVLRVALHLTGNPHDAEDLLQETFLAALRNAASWDPARGLLPWLLGILGNRARRWRRREQRVALPERLVPKPALDPDRHAAHAELVAALDQRLAHFPEHYRTVLTLYLRHGLTPAEIADALQRAPGTVRSRLLRGLELLRKALPPSLAGILAAVVMPGRGMAAVRTAVLAGGAPLEASLGVHSLLVAVGALALLSGLVWVATPSQAPGPVAVLSAPAAAAVAERQDATRPATRVAVAQGSGGPNTLIVRVRSASAGAPVSDVSVEVRPLDLPDPMLRGRWQRTGADGTVTVNGLAAGRHQVRLDRADVATRVVVQGPTEVEVTLPKGLRVRGTVLDAADAPVPHASVWLSDGPAPDEGQVVAESNRDGSFELRDVAAGRVLSAFGRGQGMATLQTVAGAPGSDFATRLFTAPAPAMVSGVVCDLAGQPIDNAAVMAGFTDMYRNQVPVTMERFGDGLVGTPRWARTDAHGRFQLEGMFPQEYPTPSQQRIWISAPGCERWFLTTDIPPAGIDLGVIRLRPGARWSGRLVDVDGATARRHALDMETTPYHMVVGRSSLQGPPWVQLRLTTDDEGRFDWLGLPPGSFVLSARAGHHIALWHQATLTEGEVRSSDLHLSPELQIHGVLVDSRGQPVRGAELLATPLQTWRLERKATADRQGRFTIEGCLDLEYTLQLRDQDSVLTRPSEVFATLRPSAEPQTVLVPDAALARSEITGVVLGADGPVANATVTVSRRDFFNEGGPDTSTDDAGCFALLRLPAGRYSVRVTTGRVVLLASRRVQLAAAEKLALPPIQIPRHGSLAGTVVDAAGVPLAQASTGLFSATEESTPVVLVRKGAIQEPCLAAPGRYLLRIPGPYRPGGMQELAETWIEIRPGEETRVELKLLPAARRTIAVVRGESHGRLDWILRLRDAEQRILWQSEGMFDRMVPERAQHDTAFFPGTYTLEAEDEQGRRARQTFTIAEPVSGAAPIELWLR